MDRYYSDLQSAVNPGPGFTPAWQRKTSNGSLNPTVLVVDDEEIVRHVLSEMLDRLGMLVLTAPDGFEAIRIFQANADSIDVVIFDLSMPEMQGDELFYSLRRMNPLVKLVLSSGLLDNMTIDEMSEHGLDGYLPKPYNIQQISSVLDRLLIDP